MTNKTNTNKVEKGKEDSRSMGNTPNVATTPSPQILIDNIDFRFKCLEEWIKDNKRKPFGIAFTDSPERRIAYFVDRNFIPFSSVESALKEILDWIEQDCRFSSFVDEEELVKKINKIFKEKLGVEVKE